MSSLCSAYKLVLVSILSAALGVSAGCNSGSSSSSRTNADGGDELGGDNSGGTNTPPMLLISMPANGSEYTDENTITFAASVTDAEDSGLEAGITWSSNLDGSFGTGGSVDTNILSVGNHTVTASVNDSGGLEGTAVVSIAINAAANNGPTLTLASPSPSLNIAVGDTITFSGAAIDNEDGDISADIFWSSSLNGSIGTGSSTSVADLNEGSHTITASVTDSDGNATDESIAIVVSEPGSIVTSSKFHVFGHSAFTYTGGDEAPNTDYTKAGEWLGLLAGASGNSSVGSFTFGQYVDHNSQNFSGDGSNVNVTGIYPIGNTSAFSGGFENQGYTHIYSMPSNFIETDIGGSSSQAAIDYTQRQIEDLIDNYTPIYPSAEHLLYVHWQDGGNNPPSNRAEFTTYNNFTMGEYLDRFVSVQDAVNANGRTIRTIPVGPVIAWLFENESYLQSLNFNDLYNDSAPHGSENIYLLVAMVCYRAVYGTNPNVNGLSIPSAATQLRSEITSNLPAIAAAIEARLNFHNANGVNVWPD